MVLEKITTFKEGQWYVFYHQHVTDYDGIDDLFLSVKEFSSEKQAHTFAENECGDEFAYRVLARATNHIYGTNKFDGKEKIQSRIKELLRDSIFSLEDFVYVNIMLEPFWDTQRYNLERYESGRRSDGTLLSGAIQIKSWGRGYSMGV